MGLFDSVKGAFDSLGKSEQTQTTGPWQPQQQYLKEGMKGASEWLNNVQDAPNQNILDGWSGQLKAAQSGFGGAVNNQNRVSNFFSSPDMLNPATNPYLAMNIDSLGTAVSQQAGRNQNQINQQAQQAGGYGGGRQGVAQGLNAESATQAFTENVNRMLMDNYNQRLQQMQSQQQYLPQQVQMSMMPYTVQESIGRSQQDEPINNIAKFWNIVGSNNWGSQSTGTRQDSPLQMFQQFGQGAGGMAKSMGGTPGG